MVSFLVILSVQIFLLNKFQKYVKQFPWFQLDFQMLKLTYCFQATQFKFMDSLVNLQDYKNQRMNQQNFEQYVKTLRSFYIKIVKGHPNMLKLSRNFMQMIDDLSKSDNTLKFSNLTRKKSQVSISGHSNPAKSVKSLRSLTNIKSSKTQYMMSTSDPKKILLFAYLHYIISESNNQMHSIIQTKSKLLIDSYQQSNKNLDKVKWERCVNQWKKIMQLLSHKSKVRWQKMMNISVSALQGQFIDVVLRSIIQQNSTNINNIVNDFKDNLQQISNLLKSEITYQQIQKNQLIKKSTFGADFKTKIKIGFIPSQNTYVYYQKLPQKSSQVVDHQTKTDKNFLSVSARPGPKHLSSNEQSPNQKSDNSDTKSRKSFDQRQKSQKNSISDTQKKRLTQPVSLMRKKNLKVIQALLKQYNTNSLKLSDLQCLQNEQNKDAKIKKMLQNRKKIQQSYQN